MSCFNASRFISEAIESVLQQTFTDFEFVIINDGSTDETLNIIQQYARTNPRIVVIKKDNTGLVDSLNVGIQAARGQWIARLDADDIALPGRLAGQFAFLQEHPSVMLLGTGCILCDQSGRQVRQYRYPPVHRALVRHMEIGGPMFPHSSAMFLKESIIQLGGYNHRLSLSEDKDLWLRISEMGRIACLREPLIGLRKHAEQISYHEGGNTQLVIGFSAIVCHFLRSEGAVDPSLLDEDTWRYFVNWITKKLDQEGVIKLSRDRLNLQQQWYAADCGALTRSVRLALGVLRTEKGCRMIIQRLFGTRLPKKLAREWKSTALAMHKISILEALQ